MLRRSLLLTPLAAALVSCGGGGGGNLPPPPPPAPVMIPDLTVFLRTLRNPDGSLAVLNGNNGAQPQRASDPWLVRRADWDDTDGQIEDAYALDDGSGFVNTFSYPPNGPFVATHGDGGDVLVSDGTTVRISFTQNGCQQGPSCPSGTTFNWWAGPGCGGEGWVAYDNKAPTGSWRSMVAHLGSGNAPKACPLFLVTAYTQWRLENVPITFIVDGSPRDVTLPCIVSEHYAGDSVAASPAMERFIYAQDVGRVLWESWVTTKPSDRPFPSPGVPVWSAAPGPGWYLGDRRMVTKVVAGDSNMSGDKYNWPPASATG